MERHAAFCFGSCPRSSSCAGALAREWLVVVGAAFTILPVLELAKRLTRQPDAAGRSSVTDAIAGDGTASGV